MELNEILELYDTPLQDLCARADRTRRECTDGTLDVCTICNAKSGLCSEDCKFCAQSVHHETGTPVYPLLEKEALVDSARRARDYGSRRFGIVTSGPRLSIEELMRIADAAGEIRNEVGIEVCASLGCLDYDQLVLLRESGVSRYHHNIETSRGYYPEIVSTHTFDDRILTVRNAVKAGLSMCSGGIIGMGESRRDRADMGLTLRELGVDSVPVNILMPISGTPLAETPPITIAEVLKTVAVFRILMPDKTIRLAAGRESFLKDFQGTAFMSGADGMLTGGYLTQRGRPVEDDRKMIDEIYQLWNS